MSRYRHDVAANGGVTAKRRRRGKLAKLPRERHVARERVQTETETHDEGDGLGAGNGLPARADRPHVRVGHPLIHEEDRVVAIYESLTWRRIRQARLFGFLVGVIVGLLLALTAGVIGMVIAFH